MSADKVMSLNELTERFWKASARVLLIGFALYVEARHLYEHPHENDGPLFLLAFASTAYVFSHDAKKVIGSVRELLTGPVYLGAVWPLYFVGLMALFAFFAVRYPATMDWMFFLAPVVWLTNIKLFDALEQAALARQRPIPATSG